MMHNRVLVGERSSTASISQDLTGVGSNITLSLGLRIEGLLTLPTQSCTVVIAYEDITFDTIVVTSTNIATYRAAYLDMSFTADSDVPSNGTFSASITCTTSLTTVVDLLLDNIVITTNNNQACSS
ncbi:hypothetical protein BX600DRAFT_455141 [Xylariales sp. PMI_506]|nr:hypothetical protein BX600DRAFT_455141 [Xylariales sp. PMI_506]